MREDDGDGPHLDPEVEGLLHRPMRSWLWRLGFALGMSVVGLNAAELPPKAEALLKRDRPLVIAHRGYSSAAPENTLPAFRWAVEVEADLVELDYHHSKDQVLTVVHDGTLDRTTDAVQRWGKGPHKVSEAKIGRAHV